VKKLPKKQKNIRKFQVELWMDDDNNMHWHTPKDIKPSQILTYGAVLTELGLNRMGLIEEPVEE
jgi:hypothetical protein